MNGKWMPLCLAIMLVIGLPRLLYGLRDLTRVDSDITTTLSMETSDEIPMETIRVLTEEGTVVMELEEYLLGVLLCEIPGEFHMEAQKAQAVVARTYAIQTVLKKNKHSENAICTKPECCQGYLNPTQFIGSGGNVERVALAKLALSQTSAQVLTYENSLIDATYFSCSGGQTEDALAVWGEDIPYLQSVPSPGEENAAHFRDSVEFSSQAFQKALGQQLTGAPTDWFGHVEYTKGGGIKSILIGDKRYTGTELRTILDLRSTAFSITTLHDTVVITTKGFGHRVGMSQYGAQAMALTGANYEEILAHYYPGTVIDKADFIG